VSTAAARGKRGAALQGRHRGERGGEMDSKNVVQVQIFGHTYTIRGEADQEYIVGVAAYVDRKMREVTEKLPVASLSKVAILASLNIADELFKERDRRQSHDEQLSQRTERLSAVLDDLIETAGGQ
jgi:cell division protein ZapA